MWGSTQGTARARQAFYHSTIPPTQQQFRDLFDIKISFTCRLLFYKLTNGLEMQEQKTKCFCFLVLGIFCFGLVFGGGEWTTAGLYNRYFEKHCSKLPKIATLPHTSYPTSSLVFFSILDDPSLYICAAEVSTWRSSLYSCPASTGYLFQDQNPLMVLYTKWHEVFA